MEQKTVLRPELEELAERVGEFIRYWGFKKVHGKIWLQVFLSAEPLDAAALIDRLGISKALASMSINDLVEYRVILPRGKSGRGTQLYAANPNIMEAILNVLRSRERKLLGEVQSSYRQLKKAAPEEREAAGIDGVKVKQLGELIACAEDMLAALLDFKEVDLSALARFTAPSAETTPPKSP